ncbi:MAG: U32 family peptidase C-terminal domain-containing protein [Defluviitaleaceae bacterium]|nr:U32 family peptidase C-terminal domain-containing protein [Defluviitaleaceae bacterium]
MKKPELLAPAGDLERLKVAFAYGADAVYMAGKTLGMRAKARNFEMEEMAEGIRHAHELGKKVYITANIAARNEDFTGIEAYFQELGKIKPDALIISDLGIFEMARQILPDMEIHISTQANSTNYASVNFWRKLGASRVILARELSIGEIAEIYKKASGMELETFVHGAMCMAYSGRCLISNYMNNRDANRGKCSQPCRWNYALVEEKSGALMPVYEDETGAYIFYSKDLCMIEHLPDLITAGVGSFKIEGRMKTSYYVGAVTKAYRRAIDDYFTDPQLYAANRADYLKELEKISHREYTTGFYYGPMTENDHCYSGDTHAKMQDFLAIVESYDQTTGFAIIEQRNKFEVGDKVEILRASDENYIQTIEAMYDEDGVEVHSAPHPKQKLRLKIDVPVSRYSMLRKTTGEC